jgi:class 3 adenylate cyclase/CHASE2 domain-containing sensor protein
MFKDKLRFGLIVGAIVGIIGAFFSYCRPDAMEDYEAVSYDARAEWSADPDRADPRIVLVDISDLDIDWMENKTDAPWPWPRELYAKVTNYLMEHGAKAVIFDLVFLDRSSLGPEDDEQFGKILAQTKRSVVGVSLSEYKSNRRPPGPWAARIGNFADCKAARKEVIRYFRYKFRTFLLPGKTKNGCVLWIGGEETLNELNRLLKDLGEIDQFKKVIQSIKTKRALNALELSRELTSTQFVFQHAALPLKGAGRLVAPRYPYIQVPQAPIALGATLGVVTQSPERDGIFRRYAPAMICKNKLLPSLALAGAMRAFPKRKLWIKKGELYWGKTRLPVDGNGKIPVRFHGSGSKTYPRIGFRHFVDVIAQESEHTEYRKNLAVVRKSLVASVRDEQRLPTAIRDTLVALWTKLEKSGCGIRLKHKRLRILEDLSAKNTWHTLRVLWAAQELAKAKAKQEGCNEAATAAVQKITALRKKFNTNFKTAKAHIFTARGLKYTLACRDPAEKVLLALHQTMSAKKAQPKRALKQALVWEKLVAANRCQHKLLNTVRRELLKTDRRRAERFKRYKDIKPGDIRGRIFFVHAAATALRDLKPSPVDRHHLGGEIMANFLDNLLNGDFIRRTPAWVSALSALLLCLLLSVGTFLVSAVTRSAGWVAVLSMVISTLVVSVYGFIAFTLFDASGVWLDLVQPSLWALAAWGGALGTNFYQEGKSRRFVQDALGRYTAPALVKELMSNPKALSLDWGENRELTVFFSDLQSFTSISERLTAEQLVQLLNDYLTEMTEIVLESGGIVDKYIGDAIMAFWGAPYDDPDHAMNACRATLKMQARITELHPKWEMEYGEDIIARCGLNTGRAVAGNMGSKHKFNYTLMGDTVNLASRFEGANKPYETLKMIGEGTYKVVKDQVVTRELDFLAVKGKERPVRVYELMCLVEDDDERCVELAERFNQAVDIYRQTKFEEALALFLKIMNDYTGDGPSKLYVSRCREYIRNPPPLDWDGVYRMKTK